MITPGTILLGSFLLFLALASLILPICWFIQGRLERWREEDHIAVKKYLKNSDYNY